MSLGVTTVEAPLGLILVGLTALMAIVFIAYVIAMQGAWLLRRARIPRKWPRSASWPTRPKHRALPN